MYMRRTERSIRKEEKSNSYLEIDQYPKLTECFAEITPLLPQVLVVLMNLDRRSDLTMFTTK